jgi:hypothetical protein
MKGEEDWDEGLEQTIWLGLHCCPEDGGHKFLQNVIPIY